MITYSKRHYRARNHCVLVGGLDPPSATTNRGTGVMVMRRMKRMRKIPRPECLPLSRASVRSTAVGQTAGRSIQHALLETKRIAVLTVLADPGVLVVPMSSSRHSSVHKHRAVTGHLARSINKVAQAFPKRICLTFKRSSERRRTIPSKKQQEHPRLQNQSSPWCAS